MNFDPSYINDEDVSGIAADWYFLSLQLKNNPSASDEIVNELIETGLRLKAVLKHGGYSYQEPLNVYVDNDTFFDVWLNNENEIQTSDLYSEKPV